MSHLYKRIELIANVAVIIVAVLLGVVTAKRFLLTPAEPKTVSAGERIALPDVAWAQSRQTVVIGLSKGCHYCAESVPFYQRLSKEVSKREHIQLVAVLPQPAEEAHSYLGELGIPINNITQAPLSSIDVRGTPTLILVDSKGVVTDVWVGKLPPEKEDEVIGKLRCETCGS